MKFIFRIVTFDLLTNLMLEALYQINESSFLDLLTTMFFCQKLHKSLHIVSFNIAILTSKAWLTKYFYNDTCHN